MPQLSIRFVYKCGLVQGGSIRMGDPQFLPTMPDIEKIHHEIAEFYQTSPDPISPAGVRDRGLFESSANRPYASWEGVEKYKKPLHKLAALFHSLVQNHPFYNGNKRTAMVTLLLVLYRQGLKFTPDITDNVLYDLVCAVAENKMIDNNARLKNDDLVKEIYIWLKNNTEKKNFVFSEMRIVDVLNLFESHGALIRYQGKDVLISNNQSSIKLSGSTDKLSGKVIKVYMDKLRLSDRYQMQSDVTRSIIHSYDKLLRRLARN